MNEQNIEEEVLDFFRDNISVSIGEDGSDIPLEFDTILQDYAEGDDFIYTIEEYDKKFGVDISKINFTYYFPWENLPLFTRWFKADRKEVEKTRKPLTVRMFAESAKTGKWIYD
ncbi:Protein of uncharacterised function (DUF1493) [Yersinia kristensenii]|nr:Protein of uncharacterised function (DUF1493) [Yersinia kristensenii]